MAEPTVAEMLLVEMRDIKRILSEAMTEQAKMRVQVDAHEQDIRALQVWRDGLPDKAQQREVQRFQMTWQNVGGVMGILTFLAYIVAPHIHLQ